jgi:hypothetical protein
MHTPHGTNALHKSFKILQLTGALMFLQGTLKAASDVSALVKFGRNAAIPMVS